MDKEKIKRVKKALTCCSEGKCEKCPIGKKDIRRCIDILLKDTLTLINDLEKEASTIINNLETENERLKQSNKNILFVNEYVIEQNQQLKDQIAELKRENAVVNRLAELEDKIESGTLVDTTNICYEKEEDRDRYKLYKLFPIQMVFDFADTQAEAEKKIKELKK